MLHLQVIRLYFSFLFPTQVLYKLSQANCYISRYNWGAKLDGFMWNLVRGLWYFVNMSYLKIISCRSQLCCTQYKSALVVMLQLTMEVQTWNRNSYMINKRILINKKICNQSYIYWNKAPQISHANFSLCVAQLI